MACTDIPGHELLRCAKDLCSIDKAKNPEEHQTAWECLIELVKRYSGAVINAAKCKNLSNNDIREFAPRLIKRLSEGSPNMHDDPESFEDEEYLVAPSHKPSQNQRRPLDMLEMGWFWSEYMLNRKKSELRKFADKMEERYTKKALVDDDKKDMSLGANLKGRASWAVDDYLREKGVINSPEPLPAPDPEPETRQDVYMPSDAAAEDTAYLWLMKQQPEDRLAYWLTDMYRVWRLPDPEDLEWLAGLNHSSTDQIAELLEEEYKDNLKSRVKHPLSAEFVGRLLGINQNTTSQRASRIRRQLRVILSSTQFEE